MIFISTQVRVWKWHHNTSLSVHAYVWMWRDVLFFNMMNDFGLVAPGSVAKSSAERNHCGEQKHHCKQNTRKCAGTSISVSDTPFIVCLQVNHRLCIGMLVYENRCGFVFLALVSKRVRSCPCTKLLTFFESFSLAYGYILCAIIFIWCIIFSYIRDDSIFKLIKHLLKRVLGKCTGKATYFSPYCFLLVDCLACWNHGHNLLARV